MKPRITEIEKYQKGTNELLDAIYDESIDGPLFIIQGSTGRRPVLAEGVEQAKEEYLKNGNDVLLQDM